MLRKVLAAAAAGTSKPAQKSDHHLPLPHSPSTATNNSSGRPPSSSPSSSPSSQFPPPHLLLGLGFPPPTSVLKSSSSSRSSFPASKNPFFSGNRPRSAAAAIGIAEALCSDNDDCGHAKTGNGFVLLGSKLRAHVSTTESSSPASSPIEFGIKTKNPSLAAPPPPPVARNFLSTKEMELSE